ncbi:MAG TPA: hypothetical protein VI197_23550 [Polyangiaceae bacterium]
MTATHPPERSTPRLERLSDQALLTEFNELVRQDHHHVASLLRHIDVIDRRKLWARKGHCSLFDLLVRRYHLSESTAGKRIGATSAGGPTSGAGGGTTGLAGERERRQAAEGVGTGAPGGQRPRLKTHRLECIASSTVTITAPRKRDV